MPKHAPHTPGPWRTGEGFHGHWPVYTMAQGQSKMIAQTMTDGETGDSQWEGASNARLMAAAPEMLETLQGLGCVCQYGIGRPGVYDHSDRCKSIQAAIDKALGTHERAYPMNIMAKV